MSQGCIEKGLWKIAQYLGNAKGDIFGGLKRRVMGGTTSLLESMMRTMNQRINVAQWSDKTALAVCKIRAAYYYNKWDIGSKVT